MSPPSSAGTWVSATDNCSGDGSNRRPDGDTIGGTVDDALFLDSLYGGSIACTFDVENGDYRVTLLFAENWHRSGDGDCPGPTLTRNQTVSIEGVQRGETMTTGPCVVNTEMAAPRSEVFAVTVADGELLVELNTAPPTDDALLSAIEVIGLAPSL